MLNRLWRGELSLPVTFWGFLIVGWITLIAVVEVLALTVLWGELLLRGVFIFGAAFGYPLVVSVAVWRSANKSLVFQVYKVAAKMAVLSIVAGFIWWIFSGGLEALFFGFIGA